MVVSDVPKSKIAPTRKMAISHPLPLVQKESVTASNPATTNIMAVSNMQSPGKDARHHTQSASCPSQEASDWSEKDWDGELRQKQRKERLEKASGYYPSELIYNPSPEREVLVLVTDLIPAPVPREIKSKSQRGKEEEERLENRRIVEGIDDD